MGSLLTGVWWRQVFAVFGAMGMLLVISLMHMHKAHAELATKHGGQFQMLYNKWGTNDNNDHWGGVGRCLCVCVCL